MTFYNHIESARYEMFRLVNGWTREGAETKARISESLDQARREYMQMESENAKLRKLLSAAYRCTNVGPSCLDCRITAGGCTLLSAMRELGIEVGS